MQIEQFDIETFEKMDADFTHLGMSGIRRLFYNKQNKHWIKAIHFYNYYNQDNAVSLMDIAKGLFDSQEITMVYNFCKESIQDQ